MPGKISLKNQIKGEDAIGKKFGREAVL